MGAKLLVALLLIALAFVFLKFMREREARLRERAVLAERLARERRGIRPDAGTGKGENDGVPETVDMSQDPETGVFRPVESGDGEAAAGRRRKAPHRD